ncbi:MAG: Mobile element protein, partial [Olavius algarvensis Gamma 1 endosymbiont]
FACMPMPPRPRRFAVSSGNQIGRSHSSPKNFTSV